MDERYRHDLLDEAAAAFTRGTFDLERYEAVVGLIASTSDAGLPAVAAELGLAPRAAAGAPVAPGGDPVMWDGFTTTMGTVKKRGDWVRAEGYRIQGSMSTFELDFREYEGVTGFRLTLELGMQMSTLKLIVPDGWVVDDRMDGSTASSFKDRGPSSVWGDNRITITGSMGMSTVKVRYK